jgi:hypothetical protein
MREKSFGFTPTCCSNKLVKRFGAASIRLRMFAMGIFPPARSISETA